MARVRLSNLSKRYPDGSDAVADLTLDVADGEFLVLVGPSGCGKSTTLRMIAGLETPTRGTLHFDDVDVTGQPAGERDIAMVFQSYALYPHMSVADNLGFPLRLGGTDRAEIRRRVSDTAELLGLTDVLDRRPASLSGGQQQRVAMGRALVRSPQVFLMDEPLSNLDARLRVQMRAEIAELQHRLGVTTIYVTHDQVEAMSMADRVAVLDGGRLQQVAPPAELYDHPANLFVASFIGTPAMCTFPATVADEAEVLLDDARAGALALGEGERQRFPLSERIGGDVVVGVRPEQVRLAPPSNALDRLIGVGEVTLVEHTGPDRYVHVDLGTDPSRQVPAAGRSEVVARIEATVAAPTVGEQVALLAAADAVHLFDAVTGDRLG